MIEIYPIPYRASVGKIFYETLDFPLIKLPKLSGYAMVLGIQGKQYISPKTNNPYIQLYPSVNT